MESLIEMLTIRPAPASSIIGVTARALMHESELFESHGGGPAITGANLGLRPGNFASAVDWLGTCRNWRFRFRHIIV